MLALLPKHALKTNVCAHQALQIPDRLLYIDTIAGVAQLAER